MKIGAYLFTINKNNGFRLSPDEIKDVYQDIETFLLDKDYNNELTRLTIRSYYERAVKAKIDQEQTAQEIAYLENGTAETPEEIELARREQLNSLTLTKVQKKIVDLLISGFEFKEISRRLKINGKCLRNQVYQIRKQNATPAQTLAPL